MAEIVECQDFNCQHNSDFKCTLKAVRMVVKENELFCENAEDDNKNRASAAEE